MAWNFHMSTPDLYSEVLVTVAIFYWKNWTWEHGNVILLLQDHFLQP